MVSPRWQLCQAEHLGREQEAVRWQGGHRPGEGRLCGCRPGGVPPGVAPEADAGARLEERLQDCLMENAFPNLRAQRWWTPSSTSTGEAWQS